MKLAICVAAGLLLASSAHAATNLVVNGDFESGNTGFTSDHAYVAPTPSALYPEGLFTIFTNPFEVHPYWVDMDGASNMMIVNGETGGTAPVVWQQSIEVGPGSYDFSAQVANVCCNSSFTGPNASSNLLFAYSFDGVTFTNFGNVMTSPPADAGVFYNLGATIASASAQTLTIRISNDVTVASGNDFAIDNIMLTAVPEPATWAMMIVGMGLAGMSLRRRAGVMAA